jgi:acetolactate synthase-1/2/3 large subunit
MTPGVSGVFTCTAGPGAINGLTGVAGAHLDSIPVVILAGQEKSVFLRPENRLRGKGTQGLPMVDIVRPITKYASILKRPEDIGVEMARCFETATLGRPGPTWLDIPQDLQTMMVDSESMDRECAKEGTSCLREPRR